MDIQVRFEDGSTELRPDNCPALYDEGRESPKRWPAWTPSDVTDGEAFPMHWGAGMGYRFLARGEDRYASRLSHFREFKTSRGNVLTPLLWRDGRWRAVAHVETVDDQIARLSKTVDAEKARANAAEKRLADLRAWAVPMIPHYDMMDQVVARIDGKAR